MHYVIVCHKNEKVSGRPLWRHFQVILNNTAHITIIIIIISIIIITTKQERQ